MAYIGFKTNFLVQHFVNNERKDDLLAEIDYSVESLAVCTITIDNFLVYDFIDAFNTKCEMDIVNMNLFQLAPLDFLLIGSLSKPVQDENEINIHTIVGRVKMKGYIRKKSWGKFILELPSEMMA